MDGYGYGGKIDELRREEFGRLDQLDKDGRPVTYLDHAGATLYAQSQIEGGKKLLESNVFGNPHSQNRSSQLSRSGIDQMRLRVLHWLNADPSLYSVVFTSGTTASLKIVGEGFPWSNQSTLSYYQGSHNSLVGVREYATRSGSQVRTFDLSHLEQSLFSSSFSSSSPSPSSSSSSPSPSSPSSPSSFDHQAINIHHFGKQVPPTKKGDSQIEKEEEEKKEEKKTELQNGGGGGKRKRHYSLVALPAQCNFSGTILPFEKFHKKMERSNSVGDHRTLFLLDAAAFLPHHPLDLRKVECDFVVLSFYKVFGYPTGLGALIVRNSSARILNKRYFGGGTVAVSLTNEMYHNLREGSPPDWLEDGTLPFLDICLLRFGFDLLEDRLGWPAVSAHLAVLTKRAFDLMKNLKHYNGTQLCVIFGSHESSFFEQGPVISFVLKQSSGALIGYSDIDFLASAQGFHLRTGCFCNPGACQEALNLSNEDVKHNFSAGHVCWDSTDIINHKSTGAIRISFGYMTTNDEIDRFISFLKTNFIEKKLNEEALKALNGHLSLSDEKKEKEKEKEKKKKKSDISPILEGLIIYPIKSCGGYSVSRGQWQITETGLKYDRQWAIIDPTNETPIRQKMMTEMATIHPLLDLNRSILVLQCPGHPSIEISLTSYPTTPHPVRFRKRVEHQLVYPPDVNQWFSRILGKDVLLVVKPPLSSLPLSPPPSSFWDLFSFQNETPKEEKEKGEQVAMNFPNESQFLAVNIASITHLNHLLGGISRKGVTASRFRPNLVIRHSIPYQEDEWDEIGVDGMKLKVIGKCTRCKMINIDQEDGSVSSEPYSTLSRYRRDGARVLFGSHISYLDQVPSEKDQVFLTVGHPVSISLHSSP